MKISIIGSGRVGSSVGLNCCLRKLGDVLLLDIVKGLPQGESLDISHQLAEQGNDCHVRGSNEYADMKNSDFIVVTNPLDPLTHLALKTLRSDKQKVMGMGGMLDLSRFKEHISTLTGMSRRSIQALVIGEHGENMLPLIRFSTISGIPLTAFINNDEAHYLVSKTQSIAAEVINLKGATVYAPGNAVSAMIEAISENTRAIMPVSALLEGEYGYSDVCIGIPCILGSNGIEKVVELELNQEEGEVFKSGVDNIKSAINNLQL